MADLLLKLLGQKADAGALITNPHLIFRSEIPVAVMVLIGLVLAVMTVLLYRRTADYAGVFKRLAMAALRIAFLGMLLVLILRPVLSFTMETLVRRGFVVLLDDTNSMTIPDPRSDATDQKRAAMGLDLIDATKGLDQELSPQDAKKAASIPRMDLLKAILKNQRLGLLDTLARDYDLKLYAFGNSPDGKRAGESGSTTLPAAQSAAGASSVGASSASAHAFVEKMTPWSNSTPIGDELRKAIARTRGQPLAGILLLTDGGNNAGSDPIMAAKTARQEGVPIYTYGVGISSPRDIILVNLNSPDVVFADDQVAVRVQVKAQNLKGESAKLVLTLGGEVMDEKPVDLSIQDQAIEMKFTPKKKGEYELIASIAPRADEAEARNNSKQQHLRVRDDKIKVLMVEQSPRWEFKYLMQQMLRDRRVDLKVFLVEADPGMAKGENTPYLAEFPKSKAELNDKFDVIIFGDVDPKIFTPEQVKNISEFVSIAGGGFIMIAGRQFAPNAYANSPIEKMLPVELEVGRQFSLSGQNADVFDKPIKMELTPTGARNGMLRLSQGEEESLRKWKELPPIYWTARVARAKPAAEVLLVDTDPAKASRFGKMPVVALQQYGLGQSMFVGTDNTWRWRRNKGDEFYITLWGQMIQRMAMPHLLGSKRTQLSADKEQYVTGERVPIYARLYDSTYEPVIDPIVKGYYQMSGGDSGSRSGREVILRPVPEQRGMYKGEFIAPAAGAYQFFVDKPGEPDVKLNFTVAEPTVEFGDTAMNEPLLREIAAMTGGEFFREENLYKLPETISRRTERVGWPVELELWSTKLFLLLLVSLVTAEWVLRKTAQLK